MKTNYISLLRCNRVALACLALAAGCSSNDSGNGAVNEATGSALGGSAGVGSSSAGAGGSSNSTAGAGGTSSEGMGGAVALGAGGSAQTGAVGAGVAGAAGAAAIDAGAPDAGRDDAGGGDAGNNPAAVTYTKDIQPILMAQCSPCHTTDRDGGHNAASSYADAVRVSADIINEIRTGGMPDTGNGNAGCRGGAPGSPGCVSAANFALIQEWVADGTPQ
jgi:hypothetical protein